MHSEGSYRVLGRIYCVVTLSLMKPGWAYAIFKDSLVGMEFAHVRCVVWWLWSLTTVSFRTRPLLLLSPIPLCEYTRFIHLVTRIMDA